MYMPTTLLRLKRFSYPREIVAYAVWAYHRFSLSTAGTEDLLAERGAIVSREAVRLWVNHFGRHFADCIRRDRPRPNHKWHMDEVVISIRGEKLWLWRAIDANGDVLEIRAQTGRDAKAGKRFFIRLIVELGEPRVDINDKLRSGIKPIMAQATSADHRTHKGVNNATEVPHRPTRKREKMFESVKD
jgi:putative transposase